MFTIEKMRHANNGIYIIDDKFRQFNIFERFMFRILVSSNIEISCKILDNYGGGVKHTKYIPGPNMSNVAEECYLRLITE